MANSCFFLDLARVSLIRHLLLGKPGRASSFRQPPPVRPMRTFIDVLRDNAVHSDRSVTFVRAAGEERVVRYPELWLEARRRAHALAAIGLQRGNRVALILPEPDE